MIAIKIILTILVCLGSALFWANGISALIICKKENTKSFSKEIWLHLGGFSTLILMMMFILFMCDNIGKDLNFKQEKPKYELIQEPLYKQINP